jgi:hypothetical protein
MLISLVHLVNISIVGDYRLVSLPFVYTVLPTILLPWSTMGDHSDNVIDVKNNSSQNYVDYYYLLFIVDNK